MAPLYELHEQTLRVGMKVRGVLDVGLIHFTVIDAGRPDPPFTPIGGAKMSMPRDDLGILHNTMIEVVLPGLLKVFPGQGSEAVPEPEIRPATPEDFEPAGRAIALSILNLVIGHYRMQADASQIRRIPSKHVTGIEYEFHHGDGTGTTGFFMGGLSAKRRPPAQVPDPDPEVVETLKKVVLYGPPPLWTSLYMDALADFDSENPISGLVHLYMAFEMLTHETCRRLGSAAVGREQIEAFLVPKKGEPPKIRTVLGRCRLYANEPSREVGKLTDQLLEHRNPIVHGQAIQLSPEIVNSAVTAFHHLSQWLSNATPLGKQTTPRRTH